MKSLLLLIPFILLFAACQSVNDKPVELYENTYVEHPDKSFFTYLRMRFFGDDEWADHKTEAKKVPVVRTNFPDLITPDLQQGQITWIGHSTFLIQYEGLNILTDPVFSGRPSPLSFVGPQRLVPLTVTPEHLPPIDVVIISHNHYDHLDEMSIQALGDNPTFVVPQGLTAWFEEQGIDSSNVVELPWWQSHLVSDSLEITATPSQHWSARGLFDRHQTHWASYVIDIKGYQFWFAGDTGYNPYEFKEIGRRYPNMDLALIPIGAYAPRHFMKTYHVNVPEAVRIHKDLGVKHSVGMHWGTFDLTSESPVEPLAVLEEIKESEPEELNFSTMSIGETLTLNRFASP